MESGWACRVTTVEFLRMAVRWISYTVNHRMAGAGRVMSLSAPPTTMHRVRNKFFFAVDLLLLPSTTLLAYAIRFEDTAWPAAAPRVLTAFIIASVPVKLLVLYMAGIYRRL